MPIDDTAHTTTDAASLPLLGQPVTVIGQPLEPYAKPLDLPPPDVSVKVELVDATAAPRRTLCEWLTHTRFGRGRLTLPTQSSGKPFLKYLYLVPLCALANLVFFTVVMMPLFAGAQLAAIESAVWSVVAQPLILAAFGLSFVVGLAVDLAKDAAVFSLLRRGLRRVALPADRPRLTHAVVITEYKEPLEILSATVRSLMAQTLAKNTIVVIAQEDRDPQADETFEALRELAGDAFLQIMRTTHSLGEGEIAGKSSNENHAVRELYAQVAAQGLDPYGVMVTVADADSLFDDVFLEQLEAEHCRQPDGRHCLYDSPINTYRNLNEAGLLVQTFEMDRSHYCTFVEPHAAIKPCQSNYSLTLGFAHAINYWDGDNTSEDMHTTLKALAFTNLGAATVVPVWSLILNDSVTGLHDRWVQAKRHMWGVEEIAWLVSLYHVLRFRVWAQLLAWNGGQMLTSVCVPPWLLFLFPQTWALLAQLQTRTLCVLGLSTMGGLAYSLLKTFTRELLLRNHVLAKRARTKVEPIPLCRWLLLALGYPLLLPLAKLLFSTCATWRMLWHARWHTSLKYICAPKQLTNWCCAPPSLSRGSSSKRLLATCCNALSGREEDISDDEQHDAPSVATIASGGDARAAPHSKAELSV